MNAVQRAIWYIEAHLHEEIALDRVAEAACVSRFHLSRAFTAVTGYPIMRYVRGRRLTVAARALADGATEILPVALEAGYGSHEAFTRAFRDQFGCTPESVRAQRSLASITLVEPIRMNDTPATKLEPPRVETRQPMLLAGLKQRHHCSDAAGIPTQWQRFSAWLGNIPGQRGDDAWGATFNADEDGNFDYLCGVEITDAAAMPAEFEHLQIPSLDYALFLHEGHVAGIRGTWMSIWNSALPEAGLEAIDAPCLERYTPAFDPRTGMGGVEILVPVARRNRAN